MSYMENKMDDLITGGLIEEERLSDAIKSKPNGKIRINKGIGARVKVYKIDLEISPEKGWVTKRNVTGVIVEDTGYEKYYFTASGGYHALYKHNIPKSKIRDFAIKLDDGLTDASGNNVIVVDVACLTFLDRITIPYAKVTENAYYNAVRTIQRYMEQNGLSEKLDTAEKRNIFNEGYSLGRKHK